MSSIHHTARGEGPVVVLLHGFCETHKIWDHILPVLPGNYHYILPDIPGFGESPLPEQPVTMEGTAGMLLDWLHEKDINEFILIGHSMGGYIALAMAKRAGQECIGLGLFHSTAAADSPEKKENRIKSARFIHEHGNEAFFKTFIPGLYHRTGPWEDRVSEMVRKTPQESVVAWTLAMRDRPDSRDFLKTYSGKTLFIAGDKDEFIDAQAMRSQAEAAKDALFALLPETGHLGMLETPEEAAVPVQRFLENVNPGSARS